MIIRSKKRVEIQLLEKGVCFLKSKVLIPQSFPKAIFDERELWVPKEGTLAIAVYLE